MLARCAGCSRCGKVSGHATPSWCRCEKTRSPGPFLALPGHVTVFEYMTPEQRADRDAARAVTNEYIAARDAGADARWTATGRRRSVKTAIYQAWATRIKLATRALSALQASCTHESRSFYSHEHCARCAIMLEAEAA